MGFETRLFNYFQVLRGHISMLLFSATKAGNTVFSSEMLQSVTGVPGVEVLALNLGFLAGCASVCHLDDSCLSNTHFSLRRSDVCCCVDVDVCSSLDHGWDCWDFVLLSTLTFLSPPDASLCAWLFPFTLWREMPSACQPASPLNASCYLFLWFPSLVLHVGPRCGYSADQELRKVYFQVSGTLIPGSLSDQWSCSVEWMELEWVQGAAQVAWLHGELWRGASNSLAFLVCRAGIGRFWSVSWGLEEKWV